MALAEPAETAVEIRVREIRAWAPPVKTLEDLLVTFLSLAIRAYPEGLESGSRFDHNLTAETARIAASTSRNASVGAQAAR
jgi:hypothetical protein